jgi:maleylacetoacetate isomerase
MSEVVLYDYWRSSASYRVRIVLNLVGIPYLSVPVDLLKKEHKSPEHLKRNPQGLVPALQIDGLLLTQSVAIIEYLAETREFPSILPATPENRARVRALAYAIAMDIHPVCNSGVVAHVMELTGKGEEARTGWMKKFIGEGLTAVETMLHATQGPLCFSPSPTLADICLLPQVYSARRWAVDMAPFNRINSICERLEQIETFARAHPDNAKPKA